MENNLENTAQSAGINENEEKPVMLNLQIVRELSEFCNQQRITFLEFENEDFKLTLRKDIKTENKEKKECPKKTF